MSKCLRCGAGGEWLEGEISFKCKDEIESLREQINILTAERDALKEAVEQALDDMGKDGHCVCEEAKQMLIAASKGKE